MMLIHECPRRDLSRIGVKRLRYCLPLKLKAEWFEDLKVRKVFGQQRGEEKPHAEDTVCTEWLNAPFVWTAKAEGLGFLRLCDVRFLQV